MGHALHCPGEASGACAPLTVCSYGGLVPSKESKVGCVAITRVCVCVCVCECVREKERERNSRLLPLRSHFHIVKMLKMLFCYEKQLVHVFIRIMGIS